MSNKYIDKFTLLLEIFQAPVEGDLFDINVVPHTLQSTTLGEVQPGCRVNLEVDLIARYLERLMLGERAVDTASTITHAFLAEHGFLK